MKYTLTIETSDAGALAVLLAGVSGVALSVSSTVTDDEDTSSDIPATGDRDSAGIPWDARIHSESKALTKDKTWRKRRKLDDAVYNMVMAELRGAPVPNTPIQQSAPSGWTPPPTVPLAVPASAAIVPTTPIPPPPMPDPTPAPAPVPQPTPPGGMQFGTFMQAYSNAVNTGKITTAELPGYLQGLGVNPAEIGTLAPPSPENAAKLQQLHDWLLQVGKL